VPVVPAREKTGVVEMKDIIHEIEELIPGNDLCEVSGLDRVYPEWYEGEQEEFLRITGLELARVDVR
jgi:hypothetical protein